MARTDSTASRGDKRRRSDASDSEPDVVASKKPKGQTMTTKTKAKTKTKVKAKAIVVSPGEKTAKSVEKVAKGINKAVGARRLSCQRRKSHRARDAEDQWTSNEHSSCEESKSSEEDWVNNTDGEALEGEEGEGGLEEDEAIVVCS